MKVYSFFRAVAEGVASQGIRGLAEEVPGGKYFAQVAEFALNRYRQLRRDAEAREEMRQMVGDEFAKHQMNAKAAADEFAPPGTSPEDKLSLELFLTQIPTAVRKTLSRPEDPTGLTVPANFTFRSADDVMKVLPPGPPRLRPGQPLPGRAGWVVDSLIGTGGFGEVWFARHTRMTALTGAVKVCPARRAADLQHEGDLINRVMAAGAHPNVVKLLDADLDGDPPWLLFEHVAGGDLTGWVHELHALPPEKRVKQAVAALGQLASAVGHFHSLNPPVVHRDLKPANILIDKASGRLRITDFGIGAVSSKDALEAERKGTATRGGRLQSSLRGSHTPLYASPQQRDGADPDPRDDVHALGVVAYQMLTGDMNRGAGADLPDDLREAGVPEPLVELIAKCVAQKPDRRPLDGNDLAARLAAVKVGAVAPPPPPPPAGGHRVVATRPDPKPKARPVAAAEVLDLPPAEATKTKVVALGIALAVVGLLLFGVVALFRTSERPRTNTAPRTAPEIKYGTDEKTWRKGPTTPDPPKPSGGGYGYYGK